MTTKHFRVFLSTLGALLVIWIIFLATKPGSPAAGMSSPTHTPTLDASNAQAEELIPITGGSEAPTQTAAQPPTATIQRAPTNTLPPAKTAISSPSPAPTIVIVQAPTNFPPDRWKEWPVMPQSVSPALRAAYQQAVSQGRIDPKAFSIIGDCQGESDGFLGVFDTSPGLVSTMAEDLQGYIRQFTGSFNRYNPAAKSGSSAGSVLYAPWNDNKEGKCTAGETPLDCELRVHRPSIVFIQLGTHFEPPDRNMLYMTTIIQKVMATGAVPILVTKADNLEGNEFVNGNIAKLATQFNLPLWNFWASVQTLPSHALKPGGMLLTPDGNTVHQVGALRVLGAVWSAVR
jgi:hypothetical protein